jgi:hypothetical protein
MICVISGIKEIIKGTIKATKKDREKKKRYAKPPP